MKIIFASNNVNKLAEIQRALGDQFELVSLTDIGFTGDIPETGRTLEANAMEKASFIFDKYGEPVFADDSGLEIDALAGEPGVDTAHYSGSRDAKANMQKVLEGLGNSEKREAKFRTVIAFVNGNEKNLFQGEVKGHISMKMVGEEGFGYDPIFIPEKGTKTFAQMTKVEKSTQSHRVRALEKFIYYLKRI